MLKTLGFANFQVFFKNIGSFKISNVFTEVLGVQNFKVFTEILEILNFKFFLNAGLAEF